MIASCLCVTGKVGFCNRVLVLMFKMCKYTLFSSTSTKDLRSTVLCSLYFSIPVVAQKGEGKNIAPQPVLTVEVRNIKYAESTSQSGIKLLVMMQE